MYTPHASPELNQLFSRKPYQGANPSDAEYLFVGLDANYEPDIGAKAIFHKVVEYHDDGVSFWGRYGVHHPFLLPEYSGDGRFYHQSFARIGFRPEHARLVSFVELLHLPTVGRNLLQVKDFSLAHLEWLNAAISEGNAKYVFIPDGVARLMRDTKCFPWLPRTASGTAPNLQTWFRNDRKTVYKHLHFSVYGKFEKQKAEELAAICSLLPTT